MLKKFIAIFLCLLLVVSFAACKKDKDNIDSSSSPSAFSDPTQDYDKDEWTEDEDLTEDEKQQVEDLWNDLLQNGGAEIRDPDDTTGDTSSKEDASDEKKMIPKAQ